MGWQKNISDLDQMLERIGSHAWTRGSTLVGERRERGAGERVRG